MKIETKTGRGTYEVPLCECRSVGFESNIMSQVGVSTEKFDTSSEDDDWM